MNLIEEYRKKYSFFYDITGISMLIHRRNKPGLLESAYEAALKYLLEKQNYLIKKDKHSYLFIGKM